MKIDVKFNSNNHSMSPEFSNSIPAGGGTNVTIDGEVQKTFAVDEYVAAAFDERLESLDAVLDGKLDKSTVINSVYGIDIKGQHFNFSIAQNGAQADTIVLRRSGGRVAAGTATEDIDAVPLKQMNDALDEKLDKIERPAGNYYLYGIDADGKTQKTYFVGYNPLVGRVPLFDNNGALRVGNPTRDDHAVPLGQLNTILDERIGNLDSALDEVLALQAFYTGETFDALHEHAERVIAGGEG